MRFSTKRQLQQRTDALSVVVVVALEPIVDVRAS
jgi:hypothetical protein